MKQSKTSKILLVGLGEAGKTSILLSLQGNRTLSSYIKIRPTTGPTPNKIQESDNTILIWDLAGQESYRKQYLTSMDEYLKDTKKIIYVIDVQDQKKYPEALDYLTQIVNLFPPAFTPEFMVFLHKLDPDIENKEDYSNANLNARLIQPIRKIVPKRVKVQVYKTTIFTIFKKALF